MILSLFIIVPNKVFARVIPGTDGYYETRWDELRSFKPDNSRFTTYMALNYDNMTKPSNGAPTDTVIGMPNVFIQEDSEGGVVRTLEGDQAKANSTSFLIAEKDETNPNGYQVLNDPFQFLGTSSKLCVSNTVNGIYGERGNLTMPKSGNQITVGTELVPVGNATVRHTFTVVNNSKEDITFILMKDVGIEIGVGWDRKSPETMKMLGNNEGISMEQNGYRLNYLFRNTINGPDNFASFGLPTGYGTRTDYYAQVDRNHYVSAPWLYQPYSGNSIHGTGMEADGYLPNQILRPNSGSNPKKAGITMKWDEVTLGPGEYKDFTYDVQFYGDFGISYLFHNQDLTKEEVYSAGDTVAFQPSGNWNKEDYQLSEGVIETTISKYVDLKNNDEVIVKAIDTSGNGLKEEEIKKVAIKDVYDKDTRLLSVPVTKEEVAKIDVNANAIGIEFEGLLNESSRNQEVHQMATIRFTESRTMTEHVRSQPIMFVVDNYEWVAPDSYELLVEKEVKQSEFFLGEKVPYQINAANTSQSTTHLKNASLVDTLPPGMGKPTSVTVDGQLVPDSKMKWDEKERQLYLSLGDIAPDEMKKINYLSTLETGKQDEIKVNKVSFSGDDVEESTTAEASFKVKMKEKRTVDFDSNGGSKVPQQIVDDGEKLAEPTDPIFLNRHFKGWYVDKELTKKYDFQTAVTADFTLYAKWQSEILDPTNSEETIEPVKPTNPTIGELRIAYVSDFDFGTSENGKEELVKQAKPDMTKDKGEVPSFVSIIDDRSEDLKKEAPWELRAKSSTFKDKNNNELKGANLLLSDLNYNSRKRNPTIVPGTLNISDSVQKLSTSNNQPEGFSWSLTLGEISEDQVSGVSLKVPYGEYKNATNYKANIEWQLVPSIKD